MGKRGPDDSVTIKFKYKAMRRSQFRVRGF